MSTGMNNRVNDVNNVPSVLSFVFQHVSVSCVTSIAYCIIRNRYT